MAWVWKTEEQKQQEDARDQAAARERFKAAHSGRTPEEDIAARGGDPNNPNEWNNYNQYLDQQRQETAKVNDWSMDPNAYEYGGRKGYSQEIANQNRAAGAAAQQREGVNMYAGDAGMNLYESRDTARNALGYLQGAASGQAPSQAAALMNAGTDQSIA